MSTSTKVAVIEERIRLKTKRAYDKQGAVFIYTLAGCTACAFIVAVYWAVMQRVAPDASAYCSAAIRDGMTQFISSMFGF
jgi:hypothetical protein